MPSAVVVAAPSEALGPLPQASDQLSLGEDGAARELLQQTALASLTEELLRPEHWRVQEGSDGPRIGLTAYQTTQLPPPLPEKLRACAQAFALPEELTMQVLVDLIATNHLGSTSIPEYCRRFNLDEAKMGGVLREALHEPAPDAPGLNEQLREVHKFLGEISKLTSADAHYVPFDWQFSRRCLFVFIYDLGGRTRLPLTEYLEYQFETARTQNSLFHAHPRLRSPLAPPRWEAERAFEQAYAEKNAAALSPWGIERGERRALLCLEMRYPFHHYLVAALHIEDDMLHLWTLSMHLPRENRADHAAQLGIFKFFAGNLQRLAGNKGCAGVCVKPDGLQVHIHEQGELPPGLGAYDFYDRIKAHAAWDDPTELIAPRQFERACPDTARLRQQALKWISATHSVRQKDAPPGWRRTLLDPPLPYQLQLMSGYLECKTGLTLGILTQQGPKELPRKYLIEAGLARFMDSGAPTVEIPKLQYRKDVPKFYRESPETSRAALDQLTNDIKRLYRVHPFALLTAAISDWAYAEGAAQVLRRRGSADLWYKNHQTKVDPDARVDAVAELLGFSPPSKGESAWTLPIAGDTPPLLAAVPPEARAAFGLALKQMLPPGRVLFPFQPGLA
jgi:hypothetical protein